MCDELAEVSAGGAKQQDELQAQVGKRILLQGIADAGYLAGHGGLEPESLRQVSSSACHWHTALEVPGDVDLVPPMRESSGVGGTQSPDQLHQHAVAEVVKDQEYLRQ